ncbi:response regulator transcription factor [Sphingomonas psychrotolerans]|uniref:Response regulator transcription factor n=1 Tax=Sphingomonas psychrotolerans TaxID=1327635 RepID=A0ABU3N8N7_9SPHN|nr:response regulator transcription factor [Sphingomonas psychrotolerans]MDT8760239.1 response regulator transcription factor [Sphingomonas psychrotolerans]
MMPRILMIEDDERLAAMVQAYLAGHGYEVAHAATSEAGLAALRDEVGIPFAAVLLDLMLPDADGLDVCRRVRSLPPPGSSIPIVMLTAKGDPFDRVIGLEIGADDYLPKPFEPRELLARLRAVLRRPQLATPGAAPLRFGRLEIDRAARTVSIDGRARVLTAYQFDLLAALAECAGRILTRDQLIERLRGDTHDPFDRSIDVHIARVRAAIEDDPKHPRRIITIRGSGYMFARLQDG